MTSSQTPAFCQSRRRLGCSPKADPYVMRV
jgi:hypothetical protein